MTVSGISLGVTVEVVHDKQNAYGLQILVWTVNTGRSCFTQILFVQFCFKMT
jgi:hypothetical protein